MFTFNASRDAKFAFNPLHYLYTVVTTFATQKALYKEYRIKQVKVHVMLDSLDGLGRYCERFCPLGFIVVVDSIKEENDFVELKNQKGNEK